MVGESGQVPPKLIDGSINQRSAESLTRTKRTDVRMVGAVWGLVGRLGGCSGRVSGELQLNKAAAMTVFRGHVWTWQPASCKSLLGFKLICLDTYSSRSVDLFVLFMI